MQAKTIRRWSRGASVAAALAVWPAAASAIDVTVRVENLSPAGGTFITPVWVGFHDGSFDLYDTGPMAPPASPALERLAEDGMTAPLSADFLGSGAGTVDGTIIGPGGAANGPIDPGEVASMNFSLDGSLASSRYFSYASMVIPSNDAFIGNGNPLAFQIFDAGGNFLGADFIVLGSMVLDAGTEMNTEAPADTAFFGQAAPNTGPDQNGTVALHGGFKPLGSGGILDDAMFANADFTASGYQVARITITPEPTAGVLAVLGGVAMLRRRRRTSI